MPKSGAAPRPRPRASPRLAERSAAAGIEGPRRTIGRTAARSRRASRSRASRAAPSPRRAAPVERTSRVKVHIYHVSTEGWVQGMNEWLPRSVLGGVYHAGVEVWGKEYWYGWGPGSNSGVTACAPKQNLQHTYFKSVDVGVTREGRRELDELLRQLKIEWTGQDYHAIKRNCCHFCDALLSRLNVQPLPPWVNRLARVSAWWGIDGSWLLSRS